MIGLWDIHNHLLPGIDDGSSCMEETVDLLYEEYRQGVRNIIFTPHFREDMFEVGEKDRRTVFARVKSYYSTYLRDALPGMSFYLGCEIYMHPDQMDRIENHEIYHMPGSNVILTEFSSMDTYSRIRRKVRFMTTYGYTCVIAHVERYDLSINDIQKLHAMENVYIQVNADSLIGKEGLKTRMFTRNLLRADLIDLIGSDGHNTSSRPVRIRDCANWIEKKYGEGTVKRIFIDNPEKIFS